MNSFTGHEPPRVFQVKAGDGAIDSDAVYDHLKQHFTEEKIIELSLLCAQADGMGKFARSLQMRTLRPTAIAACASGENPPLRNNQDG